MKEWKEALLEDKSATVVVASSTGAKRKAKTSTVRRVKHVRRSFLTRSLRRQARVRRKCVSSTKTAT